MTPLVLVAAIVIAAGPHEVMPITGLAPAVVVSDLCVYRYPAGTTSAECQTFCDQAMAYHYSYVWMEAARSYETALKHDSNCAFAWLGLHKALEKFGKSSTPKADSFLAVVGPAFQPKLPARWSKSPKDYALEMAQKLQPVASHRVSLLITAKLQEKGLWPDTKPEDRKKKATQTLDELLTLYDDDEEGWFARAQVAEGTNGAIPFYKALLRVNPLHPGANHELVHFYEVAKRPALGWPFAENYMKSSPGLPHAFHMQAHLAMRIGKWNDTTDWSVRAAELERTYHQAQGVKPTDDEQYVHHLETLTRSLVHDGRFPEAKVVQAEALGHKYMYAAEWLRMAIAGHDWPEADKLIAEVRKTDKFTAAYSAALVALEKNDTARLAAEFDVMRQAKGRRSDSKQEIRQWEIQGRLLCLNGDAGNGLKLLRKAVDKTKGDYNYHSWGNGAGLMEAWGFAALDAGHAEDASEAFQEALAHDSGSVRGALGMWALCDRLGRAEQAGRYLAVARKCWSKAEPKLFERLQAHLVAKAAKLSPGIVLAAESP